MDVYLVGDVDVIIDPPAHVIAERERLGLDRFDEVHEGEYHMVPAPSTEHQRIALRMAVALVSVVDALGFEILVENGLFDPEIPGQFSYRMPDLTVYRPDLVGTERGVDGAASLVVEVRSPRDESFKKLSFYERMGVGEVLIIDRDTKVVRRWVNGPAGMVEDRPADGTHQLLCLPVGLSTDNDLDGRARLVLDVDGTVTRI